MTEPFKRKLLTLKSPRKRQQGLSINKPQVSPQPAKKPKPIPPQMQPIPSGSKNPVWPYLCTSPAFYKHQAMAIGFLEQALANLPEGLSMRQLKKCLKLRARSESYLKQLIIGGPRYNFDGSLAGIVEPGGVEKAEHRLRQLLKQQESELTKKDTTINPCPDA